MGGNAASLRRRTPQFTPPLAAHNCEIPAFAGMVFRGTGELWADFGGGIAGDGSVWRILGVICRRYTVRFLPSQEWSSGGRGNCGRIWDKLSPYKAKQSPYKAKQSLYKAKQSPYKAKQSPCKAKQSPCKDKQSPCKDKQSPCKAKQSPCKAKQSPCKAKQSPY